MLAIMVRFLMTKQWKKTAIILFFLICQNMLAEIDITYNKNDASICRGYRFSETIFVENKDDFSKTISVSFNDKQTGFIETPGYSFELGNFSKDYIVINFNVPPLASPGTYKPEIIISAPNEEKKTVSKTIKIKNCDPQKELAGSDIILNSAPPNPYKEIMITIILICVMVIALFHHRAKKNKMHTYSPVTYHSYYAARYGYMPQTQPYTFRSNQQNYY